MSSHRVPLGLFLAIALVVISCSSTPSATPVARSAGSTSAPGGPPTPLPSIGAFRLLGETPGDDVSLAAGGGRLYAATSWGFAIFDPGSSSAPGDHCAPGQVGSVSGSAIEWQPVPGSIERLALTTDGLVGIGLTPDCLPAAFASVDAGRTWTVSRQGPDFRPTSLLVLPTGGVLASGPADLWTSRDGRGWTRRTSTVAVLGVTADGLLVGFDGGGLATSRDEGSSWASLPGTTVPSPPISTAVGDRGVLVGTDAGTYWLDLASPGPLRRLSTGRVIATAPGDVLMAALEVTADGLVLDLVDATGASAGRRIDLPSVTASVSLGGALGFVGRTLVLAVVDPQVEETVRLYAADLTASSG